MFKRSAYLLLALLITPLVAQADIPYSNELGENELLKGYTIMNSQLKRYSQYGFFYCDKKLTAEEKIPYLVTFSLRERKERDLAGKIQDVRYGVVNFYKIDILDDSFIDCKKSKNNPKTPRDFANVYYRRNGDRKPFIDFSKHPVKTYENKDGILRQTFSTSEGDGFYTADIQYRKYVVTIDLEQDNYQEGKPWRLYGRIVPNPTLGKLERSQLRRNLSYSSSLFDYNFNLKKTMKTVPSFEHNVNYIPSNQYSYANEAYSNLQSALEKMKGTPFASWGNESGIYYNLINIEDEKKYFTSKDRRALYSAFDNFPKSDLIRDVVAPKAKELARKYYNEGTPGTFEKFPRNFRIDLREQDKRRDLFYHLLTTNKGETYGAVAIYYYNDTDWWEENQNEEEGPYYYNEERECYYAVGGLIKDISSTNTIELNEYKVLDHRCYEF